MNSDIPSLRNTVEKGRSFLVQPLLGFVFRVALLEMCCCISTRVVEMQSENNGDDMWGHIIVGTMANPCKLFR